MKKLEKTILELIPKHYTQKQKTEITKKIIELAELYIYVYPHL